MVRNNQSVPAQLAMQPYTPRSVVQTTANEQSDMASGTRPQSANAPASKAQRNQAPVRKISMPARYNNIAASPGDSLPAVKKQSGSLSGLDRATAFSRDVELQKRINERRRSSDCGGYSKSTRILDVNSNPTDSRTGDSHAGVVLRTQRSELPTLQLTERSRSRLSAYEKCVTRLEQLSVAEIHKPMLETVASKSLRRYMHTLKELKARFNKLSVIKEELDIHPTLYYGRWTPI